MTKPPINPFVSDTHPGDTIPHVNQVVTFLQMEISEDPDGVVTDSRLGLMWILSGIQSALQYAQHQIQERDKRRAP